MIDDLPRLAAPTSGFKHRLASFVIRLRGWKPVGAPPAVPGCVVIAAPHTALMDGFWMLAFAWYWGIEFSWLVRRSMMSGPFGYWIRYTGAIPVDRENPAGLVEDLAKVFASRQSLFLALAPEGTRALKSHWKSGFYRIAQAARVPICMGYLDYARKEGGLGPCFTPTEINADMDAIRAFYKDKTGKFPAQFTPPRLRDEDREQLSAGER
jgi:1-acyl-sn-glycerol-3-phosphate acyltransferase